MTVTTEQGPAAVRMRGIVKRFPGVLANNGVDFEARGGEIHALLGENGAGKSTLMSVLAGVYRADAGEVELWGQPAAIGSPREAIARGVGMVHQHFMLVASQTVVENMLLGLREPRFVLNTAAMARQVRELSERYRMPVDPYARIWQLSVGEQQRVEILKQLHRGARVLILDEPTAVLTPQEADELFATLRQMTAEGKAIIFISHKLDEVRRLCQRVTVLRGGSVVAARLPVANASSADLARLMVGRDVLIRLERPSVPQGEVILETRSLCALGDRRLPALRGVSLEIRAGEVLGLAGVAGNGQRELAEALTGLRRATSGQVLLAGGEVTNRSAAALVRLGVAHIPEDRLGTGLVPNLPLTDNAILKAYRSPHMRRGPFLKRAAIAAFTDGLIREYRVSAPNRQLPARLLSGGNLQRLVLAREMATNPRLLVAVHPTRGLDVGATAAVQQAILDRRRDGLATLLISEDLDEVMAMSDRVAVIYEGQIMGVVAAGGDRAEIGLMMAGERRQGAA